MRSCRYEAYSARDWRTYHHTHGALCVHFASVELSSIYVSFISIICWYVCLQLLLFGQTPDVIMQTAQSALNFYTLQQQVSCCALPLPCCCVQHLHEQVLCAMMHQAVIFYCYQDILRAMGLPICTPVTWTDAYTWHFGRSLLAERDHAWPRRLTRSRRPAGKSWRTCTQG
jgi:hypothetical protein